MYQQIQLSVNTDKANYSNHDTVTVTVRAMKNFLPAPNEQIQVAVIRPTGKRTFRSLIHSDSSGKAIAIFKLDAKDESGSYSVEARAKDGTLALTSFLVI